jgi:hypothetical protein
MPDAARRKNQFFKDGLDRVRIDDLNPGKLRLPISRELAQMTEELLLIPDVNTLFSASQDCYNPVAASCENGCRTCKVQGDHP